MRYVLISAVSATVTALALALALALAFGWPHDRPHGAPDAEVHGACWGLRAWRPSSCRSGRAICVCIADGASPEPTCRWEWTCP